jgi:hypothetical protein
MKMGAYGRDYSSHGRQEAEREETGTRYNLQKHTPSDLLTLARPHLVKFPPLSKIVPPPGDQVFNTGAWGDISCTNHDTLTITIYHSLFTSPQLVPA